jgi:energy-coupling factor transport system permease protein
MKIKFERGRTLLHRLNPLTKLLVLIAYSLVIFTFDSIEAEILCFAAILALMLYMGSASLRSLLTSKFFLSFAVLLVAIQVIFTREGDLLFSIPLGLFDINITTAGIIIGLIVAFRFLTIIMASAIFVATTDPNELAYALMRAGLPYRYGFMLVTAIRFIPIFESEAGTVRSAQAARGLDIDGRSIMGVVNAARYTLMPLVVSALSKVDVLVISMEGRAFGYKKGRTFTRPVRFGALDATLCIAAAAIAVLFISNIWLDIFTLPHFIIYNN